MSFLWPPRVVGDEGEARWYLWGGTRVGACVIAFVSSSGFFALRGVLNKAELGDDAGRALTKIDQSVISPDLLEFGWRHSILERVRTYLGWSMRLNAFEIPEVSNDFFSIVFKSSKIVSLDCIAEIFFTLKWRDININKIGKWNSLTLGLKCLIFEVVTFHLQLLRYQQVGVEVELLLWYQAYNERLMGLWK